VPVWTEVLDEDDWQVLYCFLVASGSLKALADGYGISYPTVRARLDRLIAKVQAADDVQVADDFERKLRVLLADAQLPAGAARELLQAHRDTLRRRRGA
jgi:hypothetical protein